MNKKKLFIFLLTLLVALGVIFVVYQLFFLKNKNADTNQPTPAVSNPSNAGVVATSAPSIALVGPGDNLPSDAPDKHDLDLFSIPIPGVLSRSGELTLAQFQWLKDHGWKSVIDLRHPGERKDPIPDTQIPGFNELGFNFLSIPIKDGDIPTVAQGEEFLRFVTDPQNQPAHVHCAAGIGRTGMMVAIYRYSVQGWPMKEAIKETGLYNKEINDRQQKWLKQWAQSHVQGGYATIN